MANLDGQRSGGGNAGPWDVALYLAKKFPLFVLGAVLLGGGVYGLVVILDEKNRAQKELLEARAAIASERQASQQAIDEIRERNRRLMDAQREKADEATARAADKEMTATQRVAEAEARALLKVQDTLLTASERIQKLVLGQLKSMEDLENLRALAANERKKEMKRLQAELGQLRGLTQLAQAALDEAERKVRRAKVSFAIDNLERALVESPYQAKDAIEILMGSFDADDQDGLAEIKDRLSASEDLGLKGTLQYVLTLKTNNASWADQFVTTFESKPEAFNVIWYSTLFGCCDDPPAFLWERAFPMVAQLGSDDSVSVERRLKYVTFFGNRPNSWMRPLFLEERYAKHEDLWDLLEFVIGVVNGDYPDVSADQRVRSVEEIAVFDLAATHVWANWLAAEDWLSEEQQRRLRENIEYWADDYPILKEPPQQSLVMFWTSPDLKSNRQAYAERGTNESYK